MLYGLFRTAPPPDLFQQSDKALHLMAFAALTLTGRAALARLPAAAFWSLFLVLGPIAELAQHWLQPVRTFSLADALANLTGVLLAAGFWWLWRRRPPALR
ncbi:hypothetical protein [Marinobacterium aestuariivivens]|uniref:VanZ-like domain-containing protein n=1 Tax=Marinobacterium aestuariivivens TaxID=1698799 RepID=A0ABW1ZZA2_9GAMM